MKHLKLLLFAAITAFSVLHTGCASKGDIDPTGVYQGDAFAYNADKTITEAYAALDKFVAWEYTHRAALSKWPEIRQSADGVRANARRWIDQAIAINETYKSTPTEANRRSLAGNLAVIRAALAQAAVYYESANPPAK